MEEEPFIKIRQHFDNYVSNFSFTDPTEQQNIDLKYQHSYQVCAKMDQITQDILTKPERYTAKAMALLHDIGRFKQYQKYKTFADAESEDHAQLGIKVIKNNNILSNIDKETQQLIIKTIQYHNKPFLPKDETDKCLLYTKLLRDADKLDIWRVVITEYENKSDNSVVGLGLINNDVISNYVYHKIINREVVKYEDLKTLNDFKLLQMGWVYDINFSASFAIIKEKKYIDKLFAFLPDSSKAKKIYTKINSYLEKQIN